MKKTDEMDRNIKLRAEGFGFKAAVLALAVWTLYESWNRLFHEGSYNILPSLILIIVLCVQGFSEMAIKRKMVAGDAEYREPNRLLRSAILIVAVIAVTLSVGVYLASVAK